LRHCRARHNAGLPSEGREPETRDMQFLKTLFWVVVAIVVVLFAKANWYSVSVKLCFFI
jgi:hypothetical protein